MIEVLDKGYARLVKISGNDLDVANTARVSFDKENEALSQRDKGLIEYLVKNKHDSVFRHQIMTFEVYAPLMVARQWWKHVVASTNIDDQEGWNESSRRYITENEEFYIPDAFLASPENKKQGAGGPVDRDTNVVFKTKLLAHQELGKQLYEEAMDAGIAPEQARLFIPAYGLYVRFRWTASLNAILNFLSLRLDSHAQWEIRQYAEAIFPLVKEHFPITADAWLTYRVE